MALISADATGLLSTDGDSQFQIVYTTVTREDESVAAPPQAAQTAAPAATVAPAAASGEAAPVQSLAAAPEQESADQDSTLAATAEQAAGVVGPQGESGVALGDGFSENQMEAVAPPEIKKLPATSPAPTGNLQPESEGTGLVWRVLEGVAAVLGLIFLAALGFKWRSGRTTRVG